MQEKSLRHKLMIIISCIFVLPSFVLCYIFYEQDVTLSPTHFVLFFLIMALAVIGIILVRYIFEAVSTTADFLKKATEGGEKLSLNLHQEAVELNEISSSLNRMIGRFEKTTESLNQTKEKLHESENKYRNILENIEEGYYELDLAGNVTSFNEAYWRIYGYSREELMGRNALKLADEDNAKKAYKYFNEVYTTGKPLTWMDGEIIRKDGSKRNVEASASLILDLTGQPIGFRGIIRDVTEYRQAEELYKTLAENSLVAVFIVQDGKFRFINTSAIAYAGYSADELIDQQSDIIVHPDDRELVKSKNREMLAGRSNQAFEFRMVTKQNEVRWISQTVTPIHYQGRPAMLGNSMDITERKHAEEALRESEELYKTLAEKSMAGVYVVQDGRFRFINSNAASYAGYTREELLDQEAVLIVNPEDREKVRQDAKAMLLGEMSSPYEFMIITKQGETRWIMETVTSILYEGRRAILGNSMDITIRKQMEEEIQTLSVTDPLTGLYNRRGFLSLAEQQLKIAKRTKIGLLLLFADLDGMKWINDNLGHKKGDEALIEVANVLKKVFRDADIVARVGGDEFSVLAVGIEMEDSRIIEDRLQYEIGINNSRENRDYSLSMSVGMVYNDPENPSTIDELMSHADVLMYEQKKGRRS